ncbi:hypothetical protein MIND_01138100 [Mycena indigotica]|uniref:Uncharacterized protein n=1 Tax=Mycena indigotica TaxID=2126181 RepID=A0A8H6S7M2_9AGAR|nr:uncharacterized protein MIND_01138100 [Mycena indigotica]KAF7293591.1 hypothetical protein MIND_01138100 [Mycena indigotica]
MRGEKRGPKSKGYKAPDFDEWTRTRMNGIRTMLSLFTNPSSTSTFQNWRNSALVAARTFIESGKVLPINPYGGWTASKVTDEDLATDLRSYLRELGDVHITAAKVVQYMSRSDVMERHGLEEPISERTARRYLDELGYSFSQAKKGQYADGHEREDVVQYRNEEYLPKLRAFTDRTAYYEDDGTLVLPQLPTDKPVRVVIWYHDESIFYAHDRAQEGLATS